MIPAQEAVLYVEGLININMNRNSEVVIFNVNHEICANFAFAIIPLCMRIVVLW